MLPKHCAFLCLQGSPGTLEKVPLPRRKVYLQCFFVITACLGHWGGHIALAGLTDLQATPAAPAPLFAKDISLLSRYYAFLLS